MGAAVTPSQLRQNIYRLIEQVLETGEPLEIESKGRRLRLVADVSFDRLEMIRPIAGFIVGDPEDLVEMNWEHEWDPDEVSM